MVSAATGYLRSRYPYAIPSLDLRFEECELGVGRLMQRNEHQPDVRRDPPFLKRRLPKMTDLTTVQRIGTFASNAKPSDLTPQARTLFPKLETPAVE